MVQRLAVALSTTVLAAVGVLLPVPAFAADDPVNVDNGAQLDRRGTSWECIDPTLDRRGTSWECIDPTLDRRGTSWESIDPTLDRRGTSWESLPPSL